MMRDSAERELRKKEGWKLLAVYLQKAIDEEDFS